MLKELLTAHPEPAWNLNRRLNITANSRAANLRDRGWRIECQQGSGKGLKRDWGYELKTPRELWPDEAIELERGPRAEHVDDRDEVRQARG